jgi:hypothetical protein
MPTKVQTGDLLRMSAAFDRITQSLGQGAFPLER